MLTAIRCEPPVGAGWRYDASARTFWKWHGENGLGERVTSKAL